jgi:hypothetical protein
MNHKRIKEESKSHQASAFKAEAQRKHLKSDESIKTQNPNKIP